MSRADDQYQTTGNQIPISVDELVRFIHEKLDQYSKLVEFTGAEPDTTPFRDPIFYTMETGKVIQVPRDIQEKAIELWKNKKGHTSNQSINQTNIVGSQDDGIYSQPAPAEVMKKKQNLYDDQFVENNDYKSYDASNNSYDELYEDSEDYYQPNKLRENKIVVIKDNSYNMLYILLIIVGLFLAYQYYQKK